MTPRLTRRTNLLFATLALLSTPCLAQVGDEPLSDNEDDVVVTASRHDAVTHDLPYAVTLIDGETAQTGPDGRSLPNALAREPSVMVQKTGPGQSSPYIRGFSGYRTLFLIDGVRLNNSVWRDGPNQYAGTVDLWGIDELELVRGPRLRALGQRRHRRHGQRTHHASRRRRHLGRRLRHPLVQR